MWPILGYFIAFPLILTFSLREKEQPLVDFVKSESSQAESRFRSAQTLGAFPPLPAGEGRGEGEHTANPQQLYNLRSENTGTRRERKAGKKRFRRQPLAAFALQFQNPQCALPAADDDAGFVRR